MDFGTGGVRVGLFDREGAPAVIQSVEFATQHPRPGWAEQDPAEWWSCLVGATRGALERSGVSAHEIAGISVDATASTVLATDGQGEHLRPAIMWMDVRAADQAKRIERTGDPALKYNGFGPVTAERGLPKALWLRDGEPETWKRAARICDCADWVIQRLTGEWTASINTVSGKFYYDRDEGGFPASLYQAVGGEDLLEKLPHDVLDLGAVVGGLREVVADELGLHAGTPVAEGGIDAHVGALGLGVVEPGMLALITGSSHVIIGQAAEAIHDPGFWGAYTDAMIRGQYTIEAGQASTGSVVAWFKNNFAGAAVAEAARRGVDPYAVLNELAREVPIGSLGLVVLDYLQGNRSPDTDPQCTRPDLRPLAEPWARPSLPSHPGRRLLRYRADPPDLAQARLRASVDRRRWRDDQKRPVDADARRRLQRPHLGHRVLPQEAPAFRPGGRRCSGMVGGRW